MADFCLVSRRTLDDLEHQVFKYHFLLGAGWKLCCTRLNIDRGTFFYRIYRIEQKLGRIFCELEPYALYPLNEYFGAVVPRKSVSVFRYAEIDSLIPLIPPMAA